MSATAVSATSEAVEYASRLAAFIGASGVLVGVLELFTPRRRAAAIRERDSVRRKVYGPAKPPRVKFDHPSTRARRKRTQRQTLGRINRIGHSKGVVTYMVKPGSTAQTVALDPHLREPPRLPAPNASDTSD